MNALIQAQIQALLIELGRANARGRDAEAFRIKIAIDKLSRVVSE